MEVLDYFKEKGYPLEEAFKFHAHYQVKGWRSSEKFTDPAWKSLADQWIEQAFKFKNAKASFGAIFETGQPDYLQTSKTKNYAEPL